MSLRIGIAPPGADKASLEYVRDAERLGADSVWVPEAWMYDALTPLGYLAGITERMRLATGVVQLGARSPAMLAMSALALQKMSDGRFILGIGTSGPQVMRVGMVCGSTVRSGAPARPSTSSARSLRVND